MTRLWVPETGPIECVAWLLVAEAGRPAFSVVATSAPP
jgi:hypothetical protein